MIFSLKKVHKFLYSFFHTFRFCPLPSVLLNTLMTPFRALICVQVFVRIPPLVQLEIAIEKNYLLFMLSLLFYPSQLFTTPYTSSKRTPYAPRQQYGCHPSAETYPNFRLYAETYLQNACRREHINPLIRAIRTVVVIDIIDLNRYNHFIAFAVNSP